MEPEEIIALTEKDEPWVIDIYQNNEKYYIGTISIYPRKIRDALCKLYADGEMKLFSDESEEELYLEKLRNAPLNLDEIKGIRAFLLEEDKGYAESTDEQICEIGLKYYRQAEKSELLKRLAERDVPRTFAAMMRNLDAELSNSFLRILSTAQMRATNEIRKELNLPLLKKKQMKEFIEKPYRETENILLGIGRGGKRPHKRTVWKEEDKIAFYKQVNDLPKINNKPMWEYASNELTEKGFDYYIEEYLRKKTPFKNVPKLFSEAIRTWRKYKDELIGIKPHEKPRAFEFRHAIHLLNCPEITFYTAEKYYGQGKNANLP
jgi:hypothetical protein